MAPTKSPAAGPPPAAIVLLPALIACACAHVPSGRYVRVRAGEGLAVLAGARGIPPSRLLEANGGRRPVPGEWYFVPSEGGLLSARRRPRPAARGDLIWPVPSSRRTSSAFGRRWGRPHHGIDIPGREGAAIVAAADGRVVHEGRIGGYGNVIVLFHPGPGLFTVYAHNQGHHVRTGQRVHQGQVIARLGSTGRSTGPHLHLEVRRNSRPLDPQAHVYNRR